MFGRSKTAPPSRTEKSTCSHSAYSGHRQGNTLACSCSCPHTWTVALTAAELGLVKEWTVG